MNRHFPDTVTLQDAGMRGDSRIFRLMHFFRYHSSCGTVTIPTGFITDGASIPKVFWSILYPFGPYFPAALVHDYLYSKASNQFFHVSRETADKIFKEAMFNIGIGWITRETIYRAVRIGGRKSYKKQ